MIASNKKILDACCGSKMLWFDKNNPDVIFADIRKESHILCDKRTLEINPDVEMDFREMPFEDNSFKMVVFDPPHLVRVGEKSWMFKKYGRLSKSWQEDLKLGFDECMRVLEPNGVLIFKWNEYQIKLTQLLDAIGIKPLFGHTSGRQNKTHWLCFMKVGW